MSTDYGKLARAVAFIVRVLWKAPVSRILLIGFFSVVCVLPFAPYPWKLFQSKDFGSLEEQIREIESRERMQRYVIHSATERTSELERAMADLGQRLNKVTKERAEADATISEQEKRIAEQEKRIAEGEKTIKHLRSEVAALQNGQKILQTNQLDLRALLKAPIDENMARALSADPQKGLIFQKLPDEFTKDSAERPEASPKQSDCHPILGPC